MMDQATNSVSDDTPKQENPKKENKPEINETKTYQCDLCVVDDGSNTLNTKSHEGNKCSICGKSFEKSSKLRRHVLNVHEKMTPFKNLRALVRHKIKSHGQSPQSVHEGQIHNCEICGKSYNSKNSVELHTKSVHEKLKFSCKLCGKSFTQKHTIKKHMLDIHGIYPKNKKDNSWYTLNPVEDSVQSNQNVSNHIANTTGKKMPLKDRNGTEFF